MTNYTEQLIYGLKPVHRDERREGQSEYYYLDPRYDDDDERHQIDVENENTPNPYANEIQNYLYNNDAYRYKSLYGDTPPQQTQNNVQQLRMPACSQQQITMPKSQEPSTWDKFKNWANNTGEAMQAGAVGYTTGATLGNFDEAMGTVTAAVTGNPGNYTMGRDATRKLQNDLQQRHPYIYGGTEFVGAMQTPMHLVKDTTFANKALNAATDTLNASAGYANNWKDFGTNLAVNGFTNSIGLGVGLTPIGRGLGATGKKIIKQGFNFLTDKAKNMFYDDEDD